MTYVVWVLMVYFAGNGYNGDSAVVVDNIASQKNCAALGDTLSSQGRNGTSYTCIAVRKIKS